MIPDMLAALRLYLLADTEVAALVSTRVYNETLPEADNVAMPRKTIVLRESGGPGGFMPHIGKDRVDIRCYAESTYEARHVYRAVYDSLRYGLTRSVQGSTLLHTAMPESGPLSLVETGGGNGDWPFVLSSWLVTVAHVPVS